MSEVIKEDSSKIDVTESDLSNALPQIIEKTHPGARIVSFEKLSAGRVNDLYEVCISNPDKNLVLRLRTIKDYHYEHGVLKDRMMQGLLHGTVRTPEIYQEDNSRTILPCELTLMELIDGEVLSERDMTGDEARRSGEVLASIHSVTFDNFRSFNQESREGTDNWRVFFEQKVQQCLIELYKNDPELAQVAESFFESRMSQIPVEALPVLNHHDYHGGNLIKTPEGDIAVIDWDYASIGVPEIDFPKIRHLNFRSILALYESFLDGYRSKKGNFDKDFFERLKIYEALWLLRAYLFESTHENIDPDYFPESSYYKTEFLKIAGDNSETKTTIDRTKIQLLEALEEAGEYIFSTGLNDTGSQLFRSSMVVGMAKLHYLQEKLGIKRRAIFISTPDENPLRRQVDWLGGFAYGGKLVWGNGDLDLMVLNTKPNGCGMLVGKVDDVDFDVLEEKLKSLLGTHPSITTLRGDHIDVEWDFNLGNHFIDVFDIFDYETGEQQPYKVVIVHSDAPEMKEKNQGGMGLYYNQDNPELHRLMKKLKTPFGDVYYLTGQDAEQYLQLVGVVRDFAERKRDYVFNYLFRDGEMIMNRSHQTLINRNQIVLGAYHVPEGDNTLFPVTTNVDEASYLVRGRPSLTDDVIDGLGFKPRAKQFSVEHQLRTANVIPHGAGYTFPSLDHVTGFDIQSDNQIVPTALFKGSAERVPLTSIREIPYNYRGKEVIDKSVSLETLQVVYRLKLLWVLTKDGITRK